MKREMKNLPKLTPSELRKIRLANGEIKFHEPRDESVWVKTKKEKSRLTDARNSHKALLRSQGINPKKFINDGNLIFLKDEK